MTSGNTVAGYQVYGAFLDDATLDNIYVIGIDATASTDPVIAPGTVIYLNTDQNDKTGYSPFGNVGAEYEVQFALDATGALQPYLYSVTSAGVTTQLNGGAPLNAGFSTDGESVELAIPQALLTPAGGAAPTSINFATLINGANGLPADFTNNPEYIITDPAAVIATTTIGNLITLDGTFSDWPAVDIVMTPGNVAAGYQIHGAFLNDATLGNTYVIGIDATSSTDPVIAPGTVIYLNTDQNDATGYDLSFANIGAEYEVQFAYGSNAELQPFLYSVTSAGVTTLLNGGAPLDAGFSSNGESVELAIPQALLTPAGGAAPTSINFAALNGAQGLPSDLASDPEYTITDPATLVPVSTAIKKVGIVYSATTAALYFGGGQAGETAYSDLFMSAQHQAEAAGVSYDILTEADLTNVAKLAQYSALIFPAFQDVQSSQVSAIANALSQVVYDYHVPIITAGGFMTNDQLGNPLPGNSYANMVNLLNLTQSSYGTATYTVTPDPTALANNNPVMAGFTPGELIGGSSGLIAGTTLGTYTNYGYLDFTGVTQPATTLADINIQGGATLPGVVQTTTGGTNTVFATPEIEGDSNLLQHAIQNAVFGTTPSLAMDITRFAGILNSRNDTEDAQYPADVSPTNGDPGIYSQLIPMLQQWQQQYDFVGTYFINVGDNANTDNGNSTNWSVSLPYYDQLLQMGNEIGSHSYTHLINPPTVDANGNPIPNITVNTSEGPQTINSWSENTNTLYVTPPANGSAPNWTFAYEFGTGNSIMESNIGIPIAGAAVPGANDTVATSDQYRAVLPDLGAARRCDRLCPWAAGPGPIPAPPMLLATSTRADTGSVYIAPNITFDFTEIQYDNKTPAQADADWESLFNQLSANSATPIIVWPWHDYGPTNWNDNNPGTPGTLAYNEAMYTNFIAYAYNAGYEFVTSEDLASRIAAEQAATLSETTSGNVITATVTPAPTEPDLGAMALNVVNGTAGQVIQNAGSWYAYDSQSVFMPYGGGTFAVTLGTTQDDVTHVDYLPMRADLQSVTGDGSNLTFSFTGDGTVDVHVKTPGTNIISVLASAVGTGAGPVSATLVGDDLSLVFNDGALAISSTSPQGVPVLHDVTITEGPTAVSGATFIFAPPVTITGTAAGQATTDLTTIAPFSKVTIADPNANQTETVTVTLSAPANGTLSDLVGGTYTAATGVYTDTGTAAAVTAAVDALVFTPTANQVAPGQTITTGFTISDKDTAGLTATDSVTTVVATDVAAPPTISGTVAGQATTDLAAIAPFSKVTIADVNIAQTETVTVTLSAAANGALSDLVGGTYNAATGVYTDTGTAAQVTTALDALVFTPAINQVGRQARPSPPPLPLRTLTQRWPPRLTARRPSSPPMSAPRR